MNEILVGLESLHEHMCQNKENLKALLESSAESEDRSLTAEEKAIADKRFGEVECSIMYREGEGYFAKTHRARTGFYDSLEKLPKGKVKFVSSTS